MDQAFETPAVVAATGGQHDGEARVAEFGRRLPEWGRRQGAPT